MAAAMGTAVLLYLVLSGRLSVQDAEESRLLKEASRRRRIEKKKKREEKKNKDKAKDTKDKGKWPEKPPATLGQAVGVAAWTVRCAWKETLGKWTRGELTFGIKYYMKQQIHLHHLGPDPKLFSRELI